MLTWSHSQSPLFPPGYVALQGCAPCGLIQFTTPILCFAHAPCYLTCLALHNVSHQPAAGTIHQIHNVMHLVYYYIKHVRHIYTWKVSRGQNFVYSNYIEHVLHLAVLILHTLSCYVQNYIRSYNYRKIKPWNAPYIHTRIKQSFMIRVLTVQGSHVQV